MYALLIDTVSIQNYIFQSNYLQENLGASFIVKSLFDEFEQNENAIVGGGHCLITNLKSEDEVKNLIKNFSTNILKQYPSLTLAFSYIDNFDTQNFSHSMKNLYDKLRDNRNKYLINNVVPHSGITAECKRTGFPATEYYENDYISDISLSKLNKTEDANNDFQHTFLQNSDYRFPMNLDELGQKEGESHVAIVHLDANRMGVILQSIETLDKYKEFSKKVTALTQKSFLQLIEIVKNIKESNYELLHLKKRNLPIRPIIIGGDDITFVTDARLSFFLTEKLLHIFAENFKNQFYDKNNNPINITASAGIMIAATKYPFYRTYDAAENLTDIAKKRYNINNPKSFLAFDIAFSGFFGVNDANIRSYELTEFKDLINELRIINKWSKNKIKELRRVLYSSVSEIKIFITEMKARKFPIPPLLNNLDNNNAKEIISKYKDLVEIIDLYPDVLLKEAKNEITN